MDVHQLGDQELLTNERQKSPMCLKPECLARALLRERQNQAVDLEIIGGEYRNRTGVHGFAIRCVTTPPTRQQWSRDYMIFFDRVCKSFVNR